MEIDDKQFKIIQALIENVDNSPIGAECLEGCWETEDLHGDWKAFKEDF